MKLYVARLSNTECFKMFIVDKEKCIGCGDCVEACQVHAISMVADKARIAGNKCVDCGRCVEVCPQGAIYPGAGAQQNVFPNQGHPASGFGMGDGMGGGRGLGRGMGRGLGRGPRDGRGHGRGGGGRK